MSEPVREPAVPESAVPDPVGPEPVAPAAAVPEPIVPEPVVPEPVDEWQRLHPISPFLRGGVMILAVGGYFISQQTERLLGVQWGPEGPEDPTFGHIWLALLAFLALLALVVFYGWLSWRVAKFRIGQSKLEYRWGLLFKQHRQVRYDRIQSVDISRPLLARVFGLAQVIVQSAGGSDSQVELAYLSNAKALKVRDSVLSLVDAEESGHTPGQLTTADGAAQGEASDAYDRLSLEDRVRGGGIAPTRGREVLRTIPVPMGRLILSMLYHPMTIFAIIAVPAALLGILLGPLGLPLLFPLFFGVVLPQARRFLSEANFRVDIESDRLRITHGLTDQRSNTVPIARIQAVEISQGFFWRWPDWWRVKVTIAGVVGEENESQNVAFPVGTEEEVLDLASIMLPGLDRSAVLAGMRGFGGEPGFTTSGRKSAIFQPWAWRRNGYAVTDIALLIRRGRLARVVSLVPHARVQSMSVLQGPWDRAREIASVSLDLTAGPVSSAVPHLDLPEALRLFAEQSSRSALARKPLQRPIPLRATSAPVDQPDEHSTGREHEQATEGTARL